MSRIGNWFPGIILLGFSLNKPSISALTNFVQQVHQYCSWQIYPWENNKRAGVASRGLLDPGSFMPSEFPRMSLLGSSVNRANAAPLNLLKTLRASK